MSRFQATISTAAALATIAIASITAYKFFEGQQLNNLKQQTIIEDLKRQLEDVKRKIPTPTDQQPSVINKSDSSKTQSSSVPTDQSSPITNIPELPPIK